MLKGRVSIQRFLHKQRVLVQEDTENSSTTRMIIIGLTPLGFTNMRGF
jgi:hypothetical protein